jgi:outer membrane receptor protein involved in Fe transport
MKKQHRRESLIASFVATALASTAVLPSVVWAQQADATLKGMAAADSEVTAKNVATGLTRSTKAGSDGVYTLVGLPPGTYKVDAGPGTEQVVTLSVASTATLDLGAGKLETVTVSGTRLVEMKTSEVGTIVSLHEIETVPQLTRNFLEFADTVPGVVFNVDSTGKTSIRGGGQNDNSVNVYIDGVGQKGYVRSGLSGQAASQGNPFPQLAIGEYKVISSNYKAEYDQISSAAVTAETKSGTNKFEGEVFGTYTSDRFRAETPGELATKPNVKTRSQDKEFGIAFGGPIIQDVLHFFVTYEGKRFNTPVTVDVGGSPPAPANIIAQLPADARAQLGPGNLPFTENLYFGKLDWQPTASDRFVLSAKVRREDQLDGIATAQAASSAHSNKNDDTRVDVRWQRSADRWVNELLGTYEDAFYSPTALNFGNGAQYSYQPGGPGTGNDQTFLDTGPADPRAVQNKGQKGYALQDDLTFSHLQWWTGDHTVQMGIKHKWVKLTAQDAENINPQFFYDVSTTGTAAIPYKAVYSNPVPGLNAVATSSDRQLGLYLQDDWATTHKLTLNLGMRWDVEWNPSYLNYVTPANVVAGLNSPISPGGPTYAQTLAASPDPAIRVHINDYISTGSNRSAYKGEYQPRLGFSYDFNEDQRHVVFGGAGRAYDRDLYDYLQLEVTKSALPVNTILFNVADHPCNPKPGTCVAWNPAFLNGLSNLQALVAGTNLGNEVDLLNNNLKVPYADQFSVGMRNRVSDWNTSVALARIVSKNGFAFTLGNRYPNGAFWMNGGQPWGNGVPGFGSLIIGNNGIETRTTQLLLSAEKPFTQESHWGATIAYTYSSAKQNRDINEHYSFDEAYVTQYPFIVSNAVAKHRLVATGSVSAPWGFVVAGKLTLASPIPDNTFSCYNNGNTFSTGSHCTPFGGTAPGSGYRSVDLQLTKNFSWDITTVYVRFDALNVFNVKNLVDYVNTTDATTGLITALKYNPTGNISGTPRELRMTLGARF